jgi:anti-sigma regulatory factor (Ser/Thr protein kinase)
MIGRQEPRPDPLGIVRWDLPMSAQAPREARAFIREQLRRDLDAACLHIAELLVSELTTNAVLHGDAPIAVECALGEGNAYVAVTDASARMPELPASGGASDTGRGLTLVDALAQQWGAERRNGGKAVWFQIAARDAAATN